MELNLSDRLRTRLFAINLRLAELDQELRRTRIRVHHLESELEDARLAILVGGEAGDPQAIGSELERFRGSLASQQELVAQVRRSQGRARAELAMARLQEQALRRREDPE